jgi:hypothetical protein
MKNLWNRNFAVPRLGPEHLVKEKIGVRMAGDHFTGA